MMTGQDSSPTLSHRARLTVDDFFLLDSSGAFADYHRTELIDGEIYYINAQYRRHLMAKTDLFIAIDAQLRAIGSSLRAVPEGSVELGPHDMPEPDIILTSEPYGDGAVPGASLALLIEIADSTQSMDLGKKAMIYARGAVPEYWVLDTQAKLAHQLWSPAGDAYTQQRQIPLGTVITAETIAGLTVVLPA